MLARTFYRASDMRIDYILETILYNQLAAEFSKLYKQKVTFDAHTNTRHSKYISFSINDTPFKIIIPAIFEDCLKTFENKYKKHYYNKEDHFTINDTFNEANFYNEEVALVFDFKKFVLEEYDYNDDIKDIILQVIISYMPCDYDTFKDILNKFNYTNYKTYEDDCTKEVFIRRIFYYNLIEDRLVDTSNKSFDTILNDLL